ncbi:beta-ketoacyl synthase N-terminal-like domain-containing protein [Actinokineospora bangkokensis]|uniref:Uncharacterized protein n=1 Tax=Actinokineospora bangkokensis TaxID=1193682 RepID=A0A1Q9LJC1_9PSEU|nr:beta-ketoacyl synthase N-terminal-like domain-containing protein [Actinokineospora bangkokensis]OLR92103.1 hypothetical protein BJP25_22415 [Actinokineospora bangkokensis]
MTEAQDRAHDERPELVLAGGPGGRACAALCGAVSAAGGLGVLDLGAGDHLATAALRHAAGWPADRRFGIRVPAGCALDPAAVTAVLGPAAARLAAVVLGAGSPWRVADVPDRYFVLVEVGSDAAAAAADEQGADGLVAQVGGPGGVLLARRLLDPGRQPLPVWLRGGIGPAAAAAAVLGGAAGVVLDTQLALLPEADVPDPVLDDAQAVRFLDRFGGAAKAVRAVLNTVADAAGAAHPPVPHTTAPGSAARVRTAAELARALDAGERRLVLDEPAGGSGFAQWQAQVDVLADHPRAPGAQVVFAGGGGAGAVPLVAGLTSGLVARGVEVGLLVAGTGDVGAGTGDAAGVLGERAAQVRAELGTAWAQAPERQSLDVAVVGLACAVAGADDLDGFWAGAVHGEVPARPPGEPVAVLEVARRALADAGVAHDAERTGVVFGAGPGADLVAAQLGALGLGGPALLVDAAWASGLAAVDAARKELACGGSRVVLAGATDPVGGTACVVLKRLTDAEHDGDRVYAVLGGAGAGRGAVERAHADAGTAPAAAGLVELHGHGRPGHVDRVAGLAGVVRAAMALHTGVRPRPDGPAAPWPRAPLDRVAGIGAAGLGAAEHHLVLVGHPSAAFTRRGLRRWPAELFTFHGSAAAVQEHLAALLDLATSGTPGTLLDLARTSALRTGAGPAGVALVATGVAELVALLRRALRGETDPAAGLHRAGAEPGGVAVLFPGAGGARPGMLAHVLVAFPHLARHLGRGTLAEALHGPGALGRAGLDPGLAPAALGAAGLVYDELLGELGVVADAYAGHGYGELVALAAAGCFDPRLLVPLATGHAAFADVRLAPPRVPVFSTRDAEPRAARARWAEQVEAMHAAGVRVFVEAGPGRALGERVRAVLGGRPHVAVALEPEPGRAPGGGLPGLLAALAELAVAGVGVRTRWLTAGRGGREVPAPPVPAHPRWALGGGGLTALPPSA